MEVADNTQVNTEQTEGSKVEVLKQKIKEADGGFIPLSKPSKFGKPLLLKVTTRDFEPYPDAVQRYKKAQEKGMNYPTAPIRGVCWLTIFEKQEDGELDPISAYHWSVRGVTKEESVGRGSGSGSLKQEDFWNLLDSDPDIDRANKKWSHRAASYLTEPKHQKYGIGTFILSASLVAMDSLDIKAFQPTDLLPASTKIWAKLGLIDPVKSAFGKQEDGGYYHPRDLYISVEDSLKQPLVQQAIAEFV